MSNSGMYLIYIDESYDETHYAYSAIFINAFNWNEYFNHVIKWRKEWFDKHQIPLDYELHATKFSGGGKNIPLDRIIEDPLFKTSKSSYFIQLSDFLAFSLLRNEKPLEGSTLEPVKTAFEQLDSVLVKVAFKGDKRGKGIIRV